MRRSADFSRSVSLQRFVAFSTHLQTLGKQQIFGAVPISGLGNSGEMAYEGRNIRWRAAALNSAAARPVQTHEGGKYGCFSKVYVYDGTYAIHFQINFRSCRSNMDSYLWRLRKNPYAQYEEAGWALLISIPVAVFTTQFKASSVFSRLHMDCVVASCNMHFSPVKYTKMEESNCMRDHGKGSADM